MPIYCYIKRKTYKKLVNIWKFAYILKLSYNFPQKLYDNEETWKFQNLGQVLNFLKRTINLVILRGKIVNPSGVSLQPSRLHKWTVFFPSDPLHFAIACSLRSLGFPCFGGKYSQFPLLHQREVLFGIIGKQRWMWQSMEEIRPGRKMRQN